MKKCPQCGREYDNTMSFCLDDGGQLLYGPAKADEPATAVLSSGGVEGRSAWQEDLTRDWPSLGDEIRRDSYGEEEFRVSVERFRFDGSDTNIAALADGLTEDLIAGLSRFSYLKVVSSGSPRIDGRRPARYVVEGVLRQSGSTLRVAVQVVDGTTGANLWAEKYTVAFDGENVFEIQDKLAPQIASTIADMHGVLPRTMGERIGTRPIADLTPYEALVRGFRYFDRVTPDEWRTSLAGVAAASAKAPAYATLRAMHALLLVQGYAQGFDLSEATLAAGAEEARRAVEQSSSDHLAWFALAQALFFKKEFEGLKAAVDRSLALNPMDGNATALFGEFVSYSGDWERGLKLAEAARQLNPNFPGWYWHANFNDAYRRGEYHAALDIALKMNLNSNWGAHVMTAMAYGQLGETEHSVRAFEEAAKIRPNLVAMVPRDVRVWFDIEHGDHLMDGLRKAGIDIAKRDFPPPSQ